MYQSEFKQITQSLQKWYQDIKINSIKNIINIQIKLWKISFFEAEKSHSIVAICVIKKVILAALNHKMDNKDINSCSFIKKINNLINM